MKISHGILLRRAASQLALSLLAMAGSMYAAGTFADERIDPAGSMTVRYADLDLSRADAAGALYQRIQAAARRVCNASITYLYLETAPARQECYRLTVADAVARANLAVVKALHVEDAAEASR